MVTVFLVAAIVFGILVLFFLTHMQRKFSRGLNHNYFEKKWLEILSRVNTPDGMMLSVIDSDKLLDEALRKSGYKGKTMGERLVAAQRDLTSNDGVWFAHKLRNRLVHEPNVRIKKVEAKKALAGIKQGLKDLGAL